MKHAHVSETLLTGERIAPFAMLSDADSEPLPGRTRRPMLWEGEEWAEIDPVTGEIVARGWVGD